MTIDWKKYKDGTGFYAYVDEPEAMTLEVTEGLNGLWTSRIFKGGREIHKDSGHVGDYPAKISCQKWVITKHVETI